MKRITLVIALWAVFAATASAQKGGSEQQLSKDANELFNAGEFLKAYPLFSQLVSLYPNNPDYGFKFGACAIYSDPDKTKAIRFLSSASKKGIEDPTVWYYLGKAYHLNYQFKEAITAYENFSSKADPKLKEKLNVQREIETCIYGSGLLSNIKDLVVLNKTEADKANFFRYMNLEGIGGKILAVPTELQSKLDQKAGVTNVMHYPGNSTTIYFSSFGKDGLTGKDIYKANILPDGKFSAPEKVKGGVNTKYDEDFCFLHSDGKTLYFSSKGHNSMGGYDIFKSVVDPSTGEFGPAVNLDFAINTPDDDIFFIADSLNQKAYFASGRSSDQNHLHVYNVYVQGIPLQIVYLKGEFISEIDAEQKNATIQVRDLTTGRTVMENTTKKENGQYVLYVPKGGDYKFFVKTENSPVVHENEVKIPSFDKPVALRQELRLVKENGQDKLIITNYFEQPLEEDIAALAAEMLRKKAGLEVSDSPALPLANNSNQTANSGDLAIEKTLSNAPMAAGFGESETVATILSTMEKDAAQMKEFVQNADKNFNTAFTYAYQKQKEADEITSKAEQLKSSTSAYQTEEDVVKLRESQKLLSEAQTLRREAKGAVIAAEAIKVYKDKEAERLKELQSSIDRLKKSNDSNDFENTLAELKKEKDRIISLREGKASPESEMTAKAREEESRLHQMEEKLNGLRDREKELTNQIKQTQNLIATAKKKNDKATLESQLADQKAELDRVVRQIETQKQQTIIAGESTKNAYAGARIFEELGDENGLESLTSPVAILDEYQRNTIAMKIDAFESRFDALVVKDPQTLALIADATTNGNNISETRNSNEEENQNSTSTSDLNFTPVEKESRAETPSKTNSDEVSNPNTDTTASTAPVTMESNATASVIQQEEKQIVSKVSPNSPAFNQVDVAIKSNSLLKAETRIAEIQAKNNASLSTSEKEELTALISLKNELKAKMPAVDSKAINSQEVVKTVNTIVLDYSQQLNSIQNQPVTELEKSIRTAELQNQTIERIEAEKRANLNQLDNAATEADVVSISQRNQELDEVIASLKASSENIAIYRSGYDLESKELLGESNTRVKLENQIELTQRYMNTLESLEANKQEQLASNPSEKESIQLRNDISEIKREYELAASKIAAYESDLQLTTNTSESTATLQTTTVSSEESKSNVTNDLAQEEKATNAEKAKEVVTALFQPAQESESIFVYENGKLEELTARYPELAAKMNNLDQIKATSNEILMIEGEIEAETSAAKQKKLDRKAEDLYAKRAQYEIKNAAVIAEMTKASFDELTESVNRLNEENQEEVNSRVILRDEVQKLYTQAKSNYEEALALREKAIPVVDDIEKGDYYRQAYAKEMLAMDQMNKIVTIHDQLDLLLTFDEQQLTDMRYGRSQSQPEVVAVNETDSNASSTETASPEKSEASTTKQESTESAEVKPIETAKEIAKEAASPALVEETTSNVNANEDVVASPAVNPGVGSSEYYSNSETSNFYYDLPTTLRKNLFVRTSNSPYSNANPIPVDATMPEGTYYAVQIGAFRNKIPQNLFDQFAPVYGQTINNGIVRYTAGIFLNYENADQAKFDIRKLGYSDAFVVAYRNGKRIPLYEAMGKTEADFLSSVEKEYIYGDEGKAPSSSSSKNTAGVEANVASVSSSTSNTEYLKFYPNAAPATMVETTQGLFYTVQVGVFSKPVPSVSLKGLSPLNTEMTATGKIRYTSGIYKNLDGAVAQRAAAKSLGISDAFITAYYNGKKITLSEADRLLKEMGPSILAK